MGSPHHSFKVFEGEPEKQMLDVRSQTWVRRLQQFTNTVSFEIQHLLVCKLKAGEIQGSGVA